MTDVIPVLFEKYEDPTDVEVEFDDEGLPVVQNRDELEKTSIIRGMSADEANRYSLDVIDPCMSLWREEFEDIEMGEEYEV